MFFTILSLNSMNFYPLNFRIRHKEFSMEFSSDWIALQPTAWKRTVNKHLKVLNLFLKNISMMETFYIFDEKFIDFIRHVIQHLVGGNKNSWNLVWSSLKAHNFASSKLSNENQHTNSNVKRDFSKRNREKNF